jgi:hypothetical protein
MKLCSMNYDLDTRGGLNSRLRDGSRHDDPTVSPSFLMWLARYSTATATTTLWMQFDPPTNQGIKTPRGNYRYSHCTFWSQAYLRTSTADPTSPVLDTACLKQSSPGTLHWDGNESLTSRSIFSSGPPLDSTSDPLHCIDCLLRCSVQESPLQSSSRLPRLVQTTPPNP